MHHDNIFTVKSEHLDLLDEDTAVEFFQELLWAEARRLGIEISKINISAQVTVPDGGIDAVVVENNTSTASGLVKSGETNYQIKSGKKKPNVKDELFGKGKEPDKENLKEGIQAYLEVCGTYVLICTGIDLVDRDHRKILAQIKDYLRHCGYQDPKIEVWSQNTLRGFLKVFPSLALWVNGNAQSIFQTHQSWSRDGAMRVRFFPGQLQNELIQKIRDELRENDEAVHIRILGESGIGKTKLVFEATKVKDLSPLVVYCEASQFRDSDLMNQILRDDNHFGVVLVIDECGSRDRSYIWNKLKHRGSRIKLVTICNDYEEETSDLTPDITPLLVEEKIRDILIQEYQISEISVHRWTEFCGGLPGVAHVIGANLRDHQKNLLTLPSTTNIWEHCVSGTMDPTSQEVTERWQVLQHLALFKQFGFNGDVSPEARSIAEEVRNVNSQITWKRFRKIVLDLKKRGILKGEYTLHITPKALHIKLWKEWWENYYDEEFDLAGFTKDFTPKLCDWFYEMFKYAAESEETTEIVKELLGPKGPFQNDNHLLINLGSRLFLILAEANPESASECLKQIIEKCDRETLLRFTWRRNVVWALEKIAVWRNLFPDAARLLLALGEAENETWSNNASGVFVGLFSPARGRVAPTEAPPSERLPVLKEAFESGSKERRILALKACNEGLESDHFSRTSGAEYQGLREEPRLWDPKTYGELFDAYRQVWQLLSKQLARLPKDERETAIEILLQHTSRLARRPNLSDIVLDTIRILSEKTYVDNRLFIKTVVEFLHHNGKELPDDIRQRWEQLRDELVGSDFHSMMQRYVGMNLPVDTFDENEKYLEQGHPQIQTLAQQAVENPHLLESELPWLVTTEAYNGDAFGYQLGKKDNGFALLSTLLEARRNVVDNASAYFLGGYFRALFDINVAAWDEQLDALVDDTTLNGLIPEITYLSGMTDRAGLRLLKLAKDGIMRVEFFASFFGIRVMDNLSDEVFAEWIEFLLNSSDDLTVPIALKLYYFYYVYDKEELVLPRNLTFRLIIRPTLFENVPVLYQHFQQGNSMTDSYWVDITKGFLNLYPEKTLEFIERVLPHFGKESTIFGAFITETVSVMNELTKHYPEQVWKHVSKHLEERNFFIENWLKDGNTIDSFSMADEKGALTLIPREKIWEWIDGDVEDRAWYFAYRLVPKTLSKDEWRTSLVRAFLVRYGQREDVRRELHANYSTESWTGERSLHLESKKSKLLRIKADEENKNIKQWLEEYIEQLEEKIERARIEQERKF